jgi:hypothetical protein
LLKKTKVLEEYLQPRVPNILTCGGKQASNVLRYCTDFLWLYRLQAGHKTMAPPPPHPKKGADNCCDLLCMLILISLGGVRHFLYVINEGVKLLELQKPNPNS